jgi:hypothetical protein
MVPVLYHLADRCHIVFADHKLKGHTPYAKLKDYKW